VIIPIFLLFTADIPICTASQDQAHPVVQYAHDRYYVFWYDMRHYSPERSIYGARIAENGTVIDPEGIPLFVDRTMNVDVACDGTNFLAVIQDSC
jgi:hypothetical protein